MDSKQQEFHNHNIFFNSESANGYAEKLKHLAQKNVTTRVVFEDHTENSHPHPEIKLADQDQAEYPPSDCESGISGADSERKFRKPNNGLTRILEGNRIHEIVKKKLESSLSFYGYNSRVENIFRNHYSGIMSRARYLSFSLHAKAMEKKCDVNANIKYAWYGASKFDIDNIISYGFGLPTDSGGMHCHGINLFPVDHPVQSVQSLAADENGLRHVLLCRVILGKMEAIPPLSRQTNPTTEEFDSGVDELLYPKRYIIWSSSMNTRILAEFVVSFRTLSYCKEWQRISHPQKQPNSDWMPFAALINALSKILPHDAVDSIRKLHIDHRKQKIARQEMVRRVRYIAGDKLLISIIKSHRDKIKAGHWTQQQLKSS